MLLVFSNVLYKSSIMRSSCFLVSGYIVLCFLYVGEGNGSEAG